MTFEICIFGISIAIVVVLGFLIIEHDIDKITRSIKESKAAYSSDINDILDKIDLQMNMADLIQNIINV